MTEQLADASVSDSQSLSYTLDSTDEAKSKAVADAYRHARTSAQALATASGAERGRTLVRFGRHFRERAGMRPCSGGPARWQWPAPNAAPTEEFSPRM